MDDKQQRDMIRMMDAGQPKAVTVSFSVTLTMTHRQRDAYAADHGVDFVEIEAEARFRQDAPAVLRSIPWVAEYARVRVEKAAR